MTLVRTLALVLTVALGTSRAIDAASVVFNGDPVDPNSGAPLEILPGLPLVLPGADGLLGTADDIIDATVTGDIDLVVRSGSLPATPVIPPPAAQWGRSALPVGVAGSNG